MITFPALLNFLVRTHVSGGEMRTPFLFGLALFSVFCTKNGVDNRPEGVPEGSWILVSQDSIDSTGRSMGYMDLSSKPCPHFLVFTEDSMRTVTTGTATGDAAQTHADCYIQTSQAYGYAGDNAFTSLSNPFLRITVQEDRLTYEQAVVMIGIGRRKAVHSYRRWKGGDVPGNSPCSCGPSTP